MSRYAVRNTETGQERSFQDKQHLVDTFADECLDLNDWDGWQCLGELPSPTPTGEIPAADPIQADETQPTAETAQEVAPDDTKTEKAPAAPKASRTARAVAAVKKAVAPKKKAAKK